MRLRDFTKRLMARILDALADTLRAPHAFALSCRQRVPIRLLRGAINAAGEQGSMLVAGSPTVVSYFPKRFFSAPPRCEAVAETPIRGLEAALEKFRGQADLTIAFTDRISARLCFHRDWMRLSHPKGIVLWATRNGQPVAGTFLERRGPVLFSLLSGILDGDPEHLKRGALAAVYIHSFEYARRLGCRYFDLGGCRPSLQDGVLRFKRKWGITLRDRHAPHDFLVRWDKWTPAVEAFLAGTSLIYRHPRGLPAVAALACDEPAAQPDADRARHLLWTGGLAHLSLVSSAGWQPRVTAPSHTLLRGPVMVSDLLCP